MGHAPRGHLAVLGLHSPPISLAETEPEKKKKKISHTACRPNQGWLYFSLPA
jgi:hypothetical protein